MRKESSPPISIRSAVSASNRAIARFSIYRLIVAAAFRSPCGSTCTSTSSTQGTCVFTAVLTAPAISCDSLTVRLGSTSRCRSTWNRNPVFRAKHRSEEHTSELQSQSNLVCRLLLEKKKKKLNTLSTKDKQNTNIHINNS